MKCLKWIFLAVVLCSCQTLPKKSQDSTLPFEFRSSFWINLHHDLFNEAFRKTADANQLGPLSADEQITFKQALEYYRSHFKDRDLLFDDDLTEIKTQLS